MITEQTLDNALALLSELTDEVKKHKQHIKTDETLAVRKETRLRIKKLIASVDEIFKPQILQPGSNANTPGNKREDNQSNPG